MLGAVGLVVALLVVVLVAGEDDSDPQSEAGSTAVTDGTTATTGTTGGAPVGGDEVSPTSTTVDTGGGAGAPPASEPEMVITTPKMIEPTPSCSELVTADQLSEALGGPATFMGDQQPCAAMATVDGERASTVIAITSTFGGVSALGIDPAASTGPSELEGNSRFENTDPAEGSCYVAVAVAEDAVAPHVLAVSVITPVGDPCAAANSLTEQAFAALPDA